MPFDPPTYSIKKHCVLPAYVNTYSRLKERSFGGPPTYTYQSLYAAYSLFIGVTIQNCPSNSTIL